MPPLDYRNKVVLAPMVRIGELPTRLLALKYGADLVWGPETIDRAIIGTNRNINSLTNCIEFTKPFGGNKVIYRIHPSEQGRLIYQLGSGDARLAVEAAKLVAKDVAGVDLNCGCPKHFSIQGGMGAALLKDIPRLEGILRALVEEVGKVYDIGISCKIRLLDTNEDTYDMVRRLCRTGIIGLTVCLHLKLCCVDSRFIVELHQCEIRRKPCWIEYGELQRFAGKKECLVSLMVMLRIIMMLYE